MQAGPRLKTLEAGQHLKISDVRLLRTMKDRLPKATIHPSPSQDPPTKDMHLHIKLPPLSKAALTPPSVKLQL